MRIPKSCQSACPSVRTSRSVRTPKYSNHLRFVNISPTVVIDTSMERFSRVLQHGNTHIKKIDLQLKMPTFVFLLTIYTVMFCKQFLSYTVHIDRCYHSVHEHSSRFQHISVLTTCTFMFRRVCIIEPSFFNTTSGMHRRPFEGRHLVSIVIFA